MHCSTCKSQSMCCWVAWPDLLLHSTSEINQRGFGSFFDRVNLMMRLTLLLILFSFSVKADFVSSSGESFASMDEALKAYLSKCAPITAGRYAGKYKSYVSGTIGGNALNLKYYIWSDDSCSDIYTGGNRYETITFTEETKCPEGQQADLEGNCKCNDGSAPNALGQCENYCESEEFNQLKREKIILCNNQQGKFSYTCNGRDDVTFSCDIDSGGSDNGGSGNGNGSGSGDGSGGGTTTPETPDTDNKDVVAAIDNLKLDTNTRLDKLMEQAEAQQTAQSGKLDEVKNAIDTASDKNQQALVGVNESLDGLTDSVSNLNASNSANSSAQLAALGKLNQSVQGVGDKLNQINTTLKDTNASGVGINVCQIGECKSFYDSKFSDGLTGVLSSRFDSMKTVVTSGIADTFNAIDLGNSSRPSYTVSFDFGFANYGSFDVFAVAHLNTVFTFLRAFFMACCLFYARSLVFGG